MATEITDANFDEVVLKSTLPVMVDFWAAWCGPCKIIAPSVEELYNEYAGKAIVGKLDADNNPNTCAQFGVRNIPTVLYFKNGKVVDKSVGAMPKSMLEVRLKNIL